MSIAKLAKKFGGFYYQGAWRFPSVWQKDEFVKALAAQKK